MIINTNKASKVTATWYQCPTRVKNYLTEVTYNPNDYTTSSIQGNRYAPTSPDWDNTYPIIQIVDGMNFQNEAPHTATLFSAAHVAGDITPLDNLRWIKSNIHNRPEGDTRNYDTMNYAKNVRDLGGWACDGGTIKYGKLIRGSQCHPGDREVLVDFCGVRAELCIRRKSELIDAGYSITESPMGSDIKFYIPDELLSYKLQASANSWRQILRYIFDCIASNNPVYFHCQAGADRTGTVAAIIEAILGVSQSDIDKDYELTSFSLGVSGNTGNVLKDRRRNTSNWGCVYSAGEEPFIYQINSLTRGSTFQEKVLYWVASLGISVDEINAFRNAMIDGTPQTISLNLNNYSITKNLTNVSTTSAQTTAVEYGPLIVDLTADNHYLIDSVTVTMGGTTLSNVFTGTEVTLEREITYNLTHCTSNNNRVTVIDGQSYGAKITPSTGYTLEGATVSITMGGVDVSTYYSNGNIVIPEVTGDIIITVTAAYIAPTNLYTGRNTEIDSLNWRIGTSGPTDSNAEGCYLTNYIPVDCSNDYVIVKCTPIAPHLSSQTYPYIERVAFYDSEKHFITGGAPYVYDPPTNGNVKTAIDGNGVKIWLGSNYQDGSISPASYRSSIRYAVFDIRPKYPLVTLTDADVLTPSQLSITIENN